LWPFSNGEDVKEITPLVLPQEEKDNINVANAPGKDVTALDWNVSLLNKYIIMFKEQPTPYSMINSSQARVQKFS
jgi:hypothetical protein